jgi:hypothetical protein
LTAEGTTSRGTGSISGEVEFCIFYRLNLRTLRTKDVLRPSSKVPEISALFEPNVDLPNRFLQKTTLPQFMEIRPVGGVFIHAEGHIERPDENEKHVSRQYESA